MQIYQAWTERQNGGGYESHANANLVWVHEFYSIPRSTFQSALPGIRIINHFQLLFYIKIKNYDNSKIKVCSFSVSFPPNIWKINWKCGKFIEWSNRVKNIFLVFLMIAINILCDLWCCVHLRRVLQSNGESRRIHKDKQNRFKNTPGIDIQKMNRIRIIQERKKWERKI